jgi:hypothetical protein
MTDAAAMSVVPTLRYEDLEKSFKERGVDLRDLSGADGHFDRWRRANRLPTRDIDGAHHGSSKIFFTLYRNDPEGLAACPPNVDFWHWLLEVAKSVPWTEGPGCRWKTVPLACGVFSKPDDPGEDEIAAARARTEARTGPLDEEMWTSFRRDLVAQAPAARLSADVAERIVAEHGVDPGMGYGPMVLVRLEVSC